MEPLASAWAAVRSRAARLQQDLDLWLALLAVPRLLSPSPEQAREQIRQVLGYPPDLHARILAPGRGPRALVLGIDGLIDESLLHDTVLRPLAQGAAAGGRLLLPAAAVRRVRRAGEAA